MAFRSGAGGAGAGAGSGVRSGSGARGGGLSLSATAMATPTSRASASSGVAAPDFASMFSDYDAPVVSVPSSWRGSKRTATVECSTEPLYYADAGTQAVHTADAEAQTDELESDSLDASVFELEGWNPSASVANFLLKVAPAMNLQLERNAESHAFDDFDVFASDESDQIDCLHSLSVEWPQPEGTTDGDDFGETKKGDGAARPLPCTGLSWTATGSVLCASFGRLDHKGWCCGRGGLATWNVFRRYKATSDKATSEPQATFETMSCLMCVACHPVRPSIVAAGTFNGEVVVWDMNNTAEPCIARSSIDDYFHREPVQRVEWMRDFASKDYLLSSVSADGKVLFWSLENNLTYPLQGFRLVPPKSMRRRTKRRGGDPNAVVGGTSLSFSKDGRFSSSFVVATEGGSLYKCLLRSHTMATRNAASAAMPKAELPWDDAAKAAVLRVRPGDRHVVVRAAERHARFISARKVSMEVLYDAKPDAACLFPSPIDFGYAPHTGPVHAVDCSPFHRNLFLSSGADGRLCLFSMLQNKALTWFEPSSQYLFCSQWSRVRPLVFATGDGGGVVHIFDLQQSVAGPVATLEDTSRKAARGAGRRGDAIPPVYALSFNPRWRNLIAVGDGAGNVFVWKLGWRLSNPRPKEEKVLADMVRSWEDEGVLLEGV